MLRKLIGSMVLVAALAPALSAQSSVAPNLALPSLESILDARLLFTPESRVWFTGTSTVRSYECEAGVIGGAAFTHTDASGTVIEPLASPLQTAEMTIPVAGLECGNGTMNDHMRKALKADQHQDIKFQVKSYQVKTQTAQKATLDLVGSLTIAGKQQAVRIPAEATRQANGQLRVTGQTNLDMTSYGVKPPKLMMGTLKVGPEVTVHFDTLLKP